MQLLRARRRLFLLLGVSLLVVAAPVAVFAANHNFNGAAERQSAKWTTSGGSISGTGWHNVPGLGITRCTVREVSETATLTVSGGPVRFRAVIDGVPEAPMKPGIVRFVPNGKESVDLCVRGEHGAVRGRRRPPVRPPVAVPHRCDDHAPQGSREPGLPGRHAELLLARREAGRLSGRPASRFRPFR